MDKKKHMCIKCPELELLIDAYSKNMYCYCKRYGEYLAVEHVKLGSDTQCPGDVLNAFGIWERV